MAAKAKASDDASTGAIKLPLKLRLKAWWEGYDLNALEERYRQRMESLQAQQEKDRAAAAAAGGDDPATREVESLPGAESDDIWSEDMVNIAQFIWGEGYCGPGGPDYVVQLSKLMALSPEMSMVQIGCELGGPARVLVDRFGVWISGYDESETLVNRGNTLSEKAGLTKKAKLQKYDLDTFEGFNRKFDRAFAKEAFFTIEDKESMVEMVEDKLKPGGLLLITDYVLGSESAVGAEEYRDWKVGERSTPYCVLPDEMTAILKKHRLQVRVSEDISDTYIEMINEAWSSADEVAANLAKQEDGARKIKILMREAEFWTRRKKLLESGHLRLWRLVANKKASGPSMMSDW